MVIINHGHACFEVRSDEVSIVFDPYQDGSVPGLQLKKKIVANMVHCSHQHFDHNAFDKVEIVPPNKPIKTKEIKLPHDKENGAKRGFSTAKIVYFSDYSICHMGDIGDPKAVIERDELKNIDIVLCPINGFFTISAKEAIALQKEMGWKLLIPMHYEIAEEKTGYPDGGQINIFKTYIENYLKVNDSDVEITPDIFKYKSLIFLKRRK